MPTIRFYLAFANQPSRPLSNLAEEARRLRAILESAHRKGLCERPEVREPCGVQDLFALFEGGSSPDTAGVLHFGGHAGPVFLELVPVGHSSGTAHGERLAGFLGRQSLQLVFLNGCSTRLHMRRIRKGLLEPDLSLTVFRHPRSPGARTGPSNCGKQASRISPSPFFATASRFFAPYSVTTGGTCSAGVERTEVEVQTGTRLDSTGKVVPLSQAEWSACKRKLETPRKR